MAKSIKLNNDMYWDGSSLYNSGTGKVANVAAGGSNVLTFPSTTRGVLFMVGLQSQCGIYAVVCNTSGVVSYVALVAASDVAITASNNKLTIKNNRSSGVTHVFFIGENSSEVTSS